MQDRPFHEDGCSSFGSVLRIGYVSVQLEAVSFFQFLAMQCCPGVISLRTRRVHVCFALLLGCSRTLSSNYWMCIHLGLGQLQPPCSSFLKPLVTALSAAWISRDIYCLICNGTGVRVIFVTGLVCAFFGFYLAGAGLLGETVVLISPRKAGMVLVDLIVEV